MKFSLIKNVLYVEKCLFLLMEGKQPARSVAPWTESKNVERKGWGSVLANDECRETYTGYIAGDSRAYIYSEEKPWVKKMERWLIDFPDDVILKLKTKYGMEVEYPIEWLVINSPAKKRQKSDLKSQK